jgi:hypothetical protein
MKRNRCFEFCLMLKRGKSVGYIRAHGQAHIIRDRSLRKQLAQVMPFFTYWWKDADDRKYTLIQLGIREIEYLRPGAMSTERLTVR